MLPITVLSNKNTFIFAGLKKVEAKSMTFYLKDFKLYYLKKCYFSEILNVYLS